MGIKSALKASLRCAVKIVTNSFSFNVRARYVGLINKNNFVISIKNQGSYVLNLSDCHGFSYEAKTGGLWSVTMGEFVIDVNTEEEAQDIIRTIGRGLNPSKRRRFVRYSALAFLVYFLVQVWNATPPAQNPGYTVAPQPYQVSGGYIPDAPYVEPQAQQGNEGLDVPSDITPIPGNVLSEVGLDDPMNP